MKTKIHSLLSLIITSFLLLQCETKATTSVDETSKAVPLPINLKREDSIDFKPLMKMLVHAQIIGLGEAGHFKNEALDFRNSLIKYMATNNLIDVVAIESGITEAYELYDYVNGAKEKKIDSVLKYALSYGFHKIPQNRELIEWLREFNLNPANVHKIKLYSYDIAGGQGISNREKVYSIVLALQYLKKVDEESWKYFTNAFQPYLDKLSASEFFRTHNNYDDNYEREYLKLDEVKRNRLTWLINDLINNYEVYENIYIQKTSVDDFQWAYLAAKGARQIDNYDRNGYPSKMVNVFGLGNLFDKREQSAFENLNWIIERENNPRMLIYAATTHLFKSEVSAKFGNDSVSVNVFGNHLHKRYGDKYKVIGNLFLNEKKSKSSHYKNYYRRIENIGQEFNEFINREQVMLTSGQPHVSMSFYKSMDVLLFIEKQTSCEEERR